MIKAKGKEGLVHKEFQLPKGCSIRSVVMRELDGRDEREAAKLLTALGTLDSLDIALTEANLSMAVVAVDGVAVSQPFLDLPSYSLKTRRLIMAGFHDLNGISDDELDSFLQAEKTPDPAQEDQGVLTEEMFENVNTQD